MRGQPAVTEDDHDEPAEVDEKRRLHNRCDPLRVTPAAKHLVVLAAAK